MSTTWRGRLVSWGGALLLPALVACGAAAPAVGSATATPSAAVKGAASPSPSPSPATSPSPSPVARVAAGQSGNAEIPLVLEPLPVRVNRPVHIANAGDGSGRLFVVEKRGRILILRDGAILPTPFLDISEQVNSKGSEQGLLSVAFHPKYAENGRFFVNRTALDSSSVSEEYRVSADPNVAERTPVRTLLRLEDPAPNHNGGLLLFGPDGYMWIGTGDGGGAGDRYGNGQNRQALWGKMLRIDVDSGDPYGIPSDNPFLNDPGTRPEIWAIGLRNPWRYSFDRATGDLYIGDVGQGAYEEVDVVRAGGKPVPIGGLNFGWPVTEGQHCFPADARCDQSPFVIPVAEYPRSAGFSVTGGHVYRGSRYPQLVGRYLFGDFGSGRIWALDQPQPGQWRMVELMRSRLQISSFGEDEAGELYVADYDDNRLYRITVAGS
jgi:glucose/arabinose dehydrogenase